MTSRRALAVAVLLALGGCWKELGALAPYPCAADGTCPDGLACVPNVGCTPAQLDVPCVTGKNATDCGSPAGCWRGACENPCNTNGGCVSGRVCVSRVCLLDCASGNSCPFGLACHVVGGGPTKACMPATVFVPACASYSPGPALGCDRCGTSEAFNKVVCPNNTGWCAKDSTCLPMTKCQCNAGFGAYTCAGDRCSTQTVCDAPNWYCAPDPPLNADCNDQRFGSGTCICRNGRMVERRCTSTPCEDLCAAN